MSDTTHRRHVDRRSVLRATGGLAATGLVAGCLGGDGGDGGDGGNGDMPSITAGRLATGASSVIQPIINQQGYDEDHGFNLEVEARTDIGAYYGDFAGGTFHASAHGSIGTAGGQYNEGVPLKIIGGYSLPSIFVLSKGGIEFDTLEDFDGYTVSAPIGAGAFTLVNVLAQEAVGATVEDLAGRVINAPGPSNPILELNQDNADLAISWEPAITTFSIDQDVDIERVYSVREGYQEVLGEDGRYLVWAINDEQGHYSDHPEMMRGMLEASRDALQFIQDDPGAAADLLVEHTENPPSIEAALEIVEELYEFPNITEIRDILDTQWDLAVELGILDEKPDEGIFGTDPF